MKRSSPETYDAKVVQPPNTRRRASQNVEPKSLLDLHFDIFTNILFFCNLIHNHILRFVSKYTNNVAHRYGRLLQTVLVESRHNFFLDHRKRQYIFCSAISEGCVNVVKWIVEMFPEEFFYYQNRASPSYDKSHYYLQRAISEGHLEVAKYLVNELEYNLGKISIGQATRNGHLNILQWHFKTCATNFWDVNHPYHNSWPLIGIIRMATRHGHLGIVQWMCRDVFTVPDIYWLQEVAAEAVEHGFIEIIEWVLEWVSSETRILIIKNLFCNALHEGNRKMTTFLINYNTNLPAPFAKIMEANLDQREQMLTRHVISAAGYDFGIQLSSGLQIPTNLNFIMFLKELILTSTKIEQKR